MASQNVYSGIFEPQDRNQKIVMVKKYERVHKDRYNPHNTTAQLFCNIAGRMALTKAQLNDIERLGFIIKYV